MKPTNNTIKILLPIILFLFPLTGFTDKDAIWKDGNNIYFKYQKLEKSSTKRNSHPVELNADEIIKVVNLLKIQKKEKTEPFLTEQQTKLLGQHLAAGLKNAQPDQDVIFAMEKTVSNPKTKSFLLKGRQYFIAGRAFYQDGKLNIIIGDYDRMRDRGYEAAVDPTNVGVINYNFDHGRRSAKSKSLKNSVILTDGIEQKTVQGKKRNDWLVLDLNTAITAHARQVEVRQEEEMIQKRKELEKILGVGKSNPVKELETKKVEQASPTAAPVKTSRSLEERLTTLKQLRSKGLITEQEYTQKRQQILDEL